MCPLSTPGVLAEYPSSGHRLNFDLWPAMTQLEDCWMLAGARQEPFGATPVIGIRTGYVKWLVQGRPSACAVTTQGSTCTGLPCTNYCSKYQLGAYKGGQTELQTR